MFSCRIYNASNERKNQRNKQTEERAEKGIPRKQEICFFISTTHPGSRILLHICIYLHKNTTETVHSLKFRKIIFYFSSLPYEPLSKCRYKFLDEYTLIRYSVSYLSENFYLVIFIQFQNTFSFVQGT